MSYASSRFTTAHVLAPLLLLLPIPLPAAEPPGALWDFEAPETGWKPRDQTVTVERVDGRGATEASRAFLRVRGRIEGGWNYATTEARPIEAGRLYRLSAWIRVDRLGPATPRPYLKCEFVGDDPKADLGRAETGAADQDPLGRWQRVEGEFRIPDGAVRGWVALEKGGPGPMEIDAGLDDVRLEPIARLSALERYRLDPIPPPLAAARGVHPRLFLDAKRLAALREAVTTTHAALWKEVRDRADRYAKAGPPAYRAQPDASGDEQL